MFETVSRLCRAFGICVVVAAGGGSGAKTLAAQQGTARPPMPVGFASSYMLVRRDWIDRAATVDGCSLLRLLEAPEDYPRGFPPGLQLESSDALRMRCATPRAPFTPGLAGYPPRIYLDSLALMDTTATIYATVIRGENIHPEVAEAVRHSDGWWGIVSFTMRGMLGVRSPLAPTRTGKGTKTMAIADGRGLPLAVTITSASPGEVTLVEQPLDAQFLTEAPVRLIGDKAYDSDRLDAWLVVEHDIELIPPNRSGRGKTQDGRQLRRYCRRGKIERLFAWRQNIRRLVTRNEPHAVSFLAFVQMGCHCHPRAPRCEVAARA